MATPLVNVLIPAYNAAATLGRAIESVLRQDYAPLEVIVIDDASTDDTRAVAASYAPRGVRLVLLGVNRGVAAATNAGLSAAGGEYVAFLDADDEWLEGKLRRQFDRISADARLSFVCSGWRHVRLSGAVAAGPSRELLPVSGGEAWRSLLAASFVLKSSVLARRSRIIEVGAFDERLKVAEDQDLWIRLALSGGVAVLPDPLVVKHETPGALTARYRLTGETYVLPMIRRHLEEQRHRLSRTEVRRILGRRYSDVGRELYRANRYAEGLRYVLRAALLGDRPGENAWYLLTASPPARWIKRMQWWTALRRAPQLTKDGF